jgi:hypothetical protein
VLAVGGVTLVGLGGPRVDEPVGAPGSA